MFRDMVSSWFEGEAEGEVERFYHGFDFQGKEVLIG